MKIKSYRANVSEVKLGLDVLMDLKAFFQETEPNLQQIFIKKIMDLQTDTVKYKRT